MTTQPWSVDHFGALNLADDITEVGATGAVNGIDFDVDKLGRVRNRDGYSKVITVTTTTVGGIAGFDTTAGLNQVVVGYENGATKRLAAYSTVGGAAVSTATPANGTCNAVRWGDPTNERMYIANGADTLWRWTGAAFSQPAGMPIATHLAGSTAAPSLAGAAGTARLMAANIVGTSVSRVMFSDAGAPETWTANNYVELAPGDGSGITGMASWEGLVFAFKRRRFFVFYGEHIGSDGTPVFDYREIDGFGALVPPVAGDEGVYFFDGRAVWLTTGGAPRRVSRNIDPFLASVASLSSQSLSYAVDPNLLTSARLSYSCGRLYLSVILVGGAAGTIVYDPKLDAWMVWSTPLRSATTARPSGSQLDSVFWQDSSGGISYFRPGVTQDNGVNIDWNWVSGMYDMGYPGQVKISLESQIVGTGTASLQVATTGGASASGTAFSGASIAMTGAGLGDTAEGWLQQDFEGSLWAHTILGSTSGTVYGRVARVTHYLSLVRPPGAW